MRRDFLSDKVLFDKPDSQVILLAIEVSDLEQEIVPAVLDTDPIRFDQVVAPLFTLIVPERHNAPAPSGHASVPLPEAEQQLVIREPMRQRVGNGDAITYPSDSSPPLCPRESGHGVQS